MKKYILIMLLLNFVIVGNAMSKKNEIKAEKKQKNIIIHDESINNSYRIKLNFNRINSRYNFQKYKKSNYSTDFLSEQNPENLLELLYELSEKENFSDEAMVFIPFIREHFKNSEYQVSVINMIANQNYSFKFRYFLIDLVKSELSTQNVLYKKFITIIYSIPYEYGTNIYLKKFALSQLPANTTKTFNLLTDLMNSTSEPEMIGYIVLAMQKKKHPNLDNWLTTFLSNPSEYDDFIIRCSAMCAPKSKKSLTYIHQIGNIAMTTNSYELFKSMIFSLGNFRTEPTAVIEIINASERFDYIGVRTALRISQIAIEKMIKINQSKEYIIYGLKALQIGKIPFDISKINEIYNNTSDKKIKKECKKLSLDMLNLKKSSYNLKVLEKIKGD